jgi:hypothetical protein
MLSPQRVNSANVIRMVFVKEIRLDVNLDGNRTNEKINMTETGRRVKDATFSRGKGVALISLGSMCAWNDASRMDEYRESMNERMKQTMGLLTYHICPSSFKRVEEDEL